MKTILNFLMTVIVLGMSTLPIYGETSNSDYKPYLDPGKVWFEEFVYFPDDDDSFRELIHVVKNTVGDKVVIDGEECYKVYTTSDSYYVKPYFTYMKEKDGVVSIFSGLDGKWSVLYNFNVKVGDVLMFTDGPYSKVSYTVSEISEVEVRGMSRRFIKFDNQNGKHCATWVEGIGDVSGTGLLIRYIPTGGAGYGYIRRPVEWYEEGKLVFTENDFREAPWTPNSQKHESCLIDGRTYVMEQVVDYPDPESHSSEYLSMTIKFTATIGEHVDGRHVDLKYLTQDIPPIIGLGDDVRYSLYEIMDRDIYIQIPSNRETLVRTVPFNFNYINSFIIYDIEGNPSDSWLEFSRHDTFQLNGKTYSRWTMDKYTYSMQKDNLYDVIVEGIGSSRGGFGYIKFPEADNGVHYHAPKVLEIYDDGELIFTYEDFFKGLKDAHVKDIQYERTIRDNSSIYDIYGNIVSSTQPGSIYIRNGKKFIAH